MHYYGELYGKAGSRSYFPTGKTGKDWDELEKERDQLRDAIRKAATEFKAVTWGWDGDCGTDEIMERLEAHLPENTGLRDRPESATPPKQTNSPL